MSTRGRTVRRVADKAAASCVWRHTNAAGTQPIASSTECGPLLIAAGKRANDRLIAEAKAVPCVDCGRRWFPWQMDFDHIRGEKHFDIGSGRFQRTPAQVAAEIAKCEVVCAVCHRLRTARRMA